MRTASLLLTIVAVLGLTACAKPKLGVVDPNAPVYNYKVRIANQGDTNLDASSFALTFERNAGMQGDTFQTITMTRVPGDSYNLQITGKFLALRVSNTGPNGLLYSVTRVSAPYDNSSPTVGIIGGALPAGTFKDLTDL